jgi:hypothetical protein
MIHNTLQGIFEALQFFNTLPPAIDPPVCPVELIIQHQGDHGGQPGGDNAGQDPWPVPGGVLLAEDCSVVSIPKLTRLSPCGDNVNAGEMSGDGYCG